MRGEQHACPPLTTQSLERRFKPLKPVLARAHPHEAILALATPLQERVHRHRLILGVSVQLGSKPASSPDPRQPRTCVPSICPLLPFYGTFTT